MSAFPPPTYYFSGIDFNSDFYNDTVAVVSGGGTGDLTEAIANTLYLRKTVADTATALETFTAGIQTNTIDTNTVGVLTIGGTNATSIALNEPVTMSGTLGVTGVLTTNGGLKSNSIEPRILTNNMTIGTTINDANTITFGKAGGQRVNFASGLTTSNINGVVSAIFESPAGIALTIGGNNAVGVNIGNFIGGTSGSTVNVPTLDAISVNTFDVDNTTGGELVIGVKASFVSIANKDDPLGVIPYFSFTEFNSTLITNTINFHSNANFQTIYDSRIVAIGGTISDGGGTLQLESNNMTLTANNLDIDTPVNFNNSAIFNNSLTGSSIYCNTYDSSISGAPMNIGNAFATSVEISRLGINTNVLAACNITGITTATGGLRTNDVDRITSGSLAIGSNALTTAVSIQKPLTLSNPLILGSVPTLSSQLGYTELNSFTGTADRTGVLATAGTALASLPAGIWSVSYLLKVSGDLSAITVTRFYSYVEASPSVTNVPLLAATGGANSFAVGTGQTDASVNQSGSVIVKTTAATVFTLKYYLTAGNTALFRSGCYLSATRIG